MLTKTHVTLIIALSVVAWVAVLWVLKLPIGLAYLKPFTIVVSIVSALVFVFDKWLWRLPIFRAWLVKTPYIEGTWKVELVSDYKSPDTGELVDTIKATLVIKQTLSTATGRLETPQSSSTLVAHDFTSIDDGFEFSAVYRNEPGIDVRDDSEIHYGAFRLRVSEYAPRKIRGYYWTDRSTTGAMILKLKKSR